MPSVLQTNFEVSSYDIECFSVWSNPFPIPTMILYSHTYYDYLEKSVDFITYFLFLQPLSMLSCSFLMTAVVMFCTSCCNRTVAKSSSYVSLALKDLSFLTETIHCYLRYCNDLPCRCGGGRCTREVLSAKKASLVIIMLSLSAIKLYFYNSCNSKQIYLPLRCAQQI